MEESVYLSKGSRAVRQLQAGHVDPLFYSINFQFHVQEAFRSESYSLSKWKKKRYCLLKPSVSS